MEEKPNNKYENKAIRFYDKKNHYELWFMDDFVMPSSGKAYAGDPEYTLICDILEDLHSADKHKEIHVFVNSYGGFLDTLCGLFMELKSFRHKVAINLGTCCSCAFLLYFLCDEYYAADHSQFMYHEPSCFNFGKVEETAKSIEHNRIRFTSILKETHVDEILTREEMTLGETTEVWLTGEQLINRKKIKPYHLYNSRICPQEVEHEFYSYKGEIYRAVEHQMIKYVPEWEGIKDPVTSLTHYTNEVLTLGNIEAVYKVLQELTTNMKKAVKSSDLNQLSEEERAKLTLLLNTL